MKISLYANQSNFSLCLFLLRSSDTSRSRDTIISPIARNRPNSTFQPIPLKPQKLLKTSSADDSAISSAPNTSKQLKDELNKLGRLDGLISNPSSKLNKVRVPDSKKIAAILLETNIVELQRHLLTITVQNQVSALLPVLPVVKNANWN